MRKNLSLVVKKVCLNQIETTLKKAYEKNQLLKVKVTDNNVLRGGDYPSYKVEFEINQENIQQYMREFS